MKHIASFVFAALLGIVLFGCSAPTTPAELPANADAYFFQQNTTFQYTYSQASAISTSTTTYQTSLVDPTVYGSYLQLKTDQTSPAGNVLFYFKNVQGADGSVSCILSNSAATTGFVALKGSLEIGAAWFADSAQTIQASVVGKYAEYYLPGRLQHYSDVVVVKYSNVNASADNYIVRYFARDYGLILERTVTGPSSEIVDLQLVSFEGNLLGSNPDLHHDHWFNLNPRYEANMITQDPLQK